MLRDSIGIDVWSLRTCLAERVVGIGHDGADERVSVDGTGVGWFATLGECESGRREMAAIRWLCRRR
jgi:hypothetical protein